MENGPEPHIVIASLVVCSLLIRQVLVFSGQHWMRTYAHTLTAVLLPLITYSITAVIAGNIALSLGMVGALSIVRFRNPVKSPFELVVFFLLITMGITAGAKLEVLIALTIVTILVLIGFKYFDSIYQRIYKKNFFQISFSEGAELPTIEVESDEPLEGLLESDLLVSFLLDDARYHYVLASRNKLELLEFVQTFEAAKSVSKVRYSTF